jgi:hypothetical protein
MSGVRIVNESFASIYFTPFQEKTKRNRKFARVIKIEEKSSKFQLNHRVEKFTPS